MLKELQDLIDKVNRSSESAGLSLNLKNEGTEDIGEANQDDEAECRAEFEEICGDIAAV